MLSKVKTGAAYNSIPVADTHTLQTTSFTPWNKDYTSLLNFATPRDWFYYKYNVSFDLVSYNNSAYGSTLETKIDGVWDYIIVKTINEKTQSFSLEWERSIFLYFHNKLDYGYNVTLSNFSITRQLWVMHTVVSTNGKPRELKQIAQKASITIFGKHIDNTRITQDAE